MRKSRLLAGLAAVAIGAVAVPASAQTPVTVTLTNPAGARVMYVETMEGAPLTELAFGERRSIPFRVRVQDQAFGRQAFSISATMTNLYQAPGGVVDHDATPIASREVTLGRQGTPLAVAGVTAIVQPVIDTQSQLLNPTLCGVLGLSTVVLGGSGCVLEGTDILGTVQEVTVPIDLSEVGALPLVPQANEVGAFTNPEFGANTAADGDDAGDGAPAATARRVLSGAPLPVDLAPLTSAVAALNVGDALIDENALLADLFASYPALAGFNDTVLDGIVDSTVATLENLTVANILKQTGTYSALPTLDVDVPAGAKEGAYKGTLVVTGLQ